MKASALIDGALAAIGIRRMPPLRPNVLAGVQRELTDRYLPRFTSEPTSSHRVVATDDELCEFVRDTCRRHTRAATGLTIGFVWATRSRRKVRAR